MEKVNNGGPAFPREDYQANGYDKGFEKLGQEGMSLRDYFAAKAMQGELASGDASNHVENIASRSYAIADAMLKARG
ncbi:TPA: hypothetical protein QCG78_004359 [Enterobacter asburiae]|nr:hypothetical protein EATA8330_12250 [Enterobacter asburiae]HEC5301787.1 hypothetical protein [Enterobacter asburiae]